MAMSCRLYPYQYGLAFVADDVLVEPVVERTHLNWVLPRVPRAPPCGCLCICAMSQRSLSLFDRRLWIDCVCQTAVNLDRFPQRQLRVSASVYIFNQIRLPEPVSLQLALFQK